MSTKQRAVDREQIGAVHDLIRAHIRRTPVVEVDAGDFGLESSVRLSLKLELLQHAGSFKARGAFANLLTRAIPEAGVVAASGGNHGAAVAFAARRLGFPAKIFVPSVASPAKLGQIRDYGAELVVGGERYADALAASERWVATSGALAVHAYDQPETLLGQGTVGAEFEEQSPGLDTLLVAVGGGGLIGGVAAWFAGARNSRVRIVGVEPERAPTLTKALAAGRPVEAEAGGIAADSLAPARVGEVMFPIAQRHVDHVVLVSDDAMRAAQEALWRVLRVVAEPGGAAAFAAVLSGQYRLRKGEHVGILVCGGNTTAVEFGSDKDPGHRETRMAKDVVTTDRIAEPVGPFSPGVRAGEWLYLSGQVAQDPTTGRLVEGNVAQQAEQIFRNVGAVLHAGGKTFADVVKVSVFLTDMRDFQAMNAVYARHFAAPYPARTTVAVAALPLGGTVEIDLVAR